MMLWTDFSVLESDVSSPSHCIKLLGFLLMERLVFSLGRRSRPHPHPPAVWPQQTDFQGLRCAARGPRHCTQVGLCPVLMVAISNCSIRVAIFFLPTSKASFLEHNFVPPTQFLAFSHQVFRFDKCFSLNGCCQCGEFEHLQWNRPPFRYNLHFLHLCTSFLMVDRIQP